MGTTARPRGGFKEAAALFRFGHRIIREDAIWYIGNRGRLLVEARSHGYHDGKRRVWGPVIPAGTDVLCMGDSTYLSWTLHGGWVGQWDVEDPATGLHARVPHEALLLTGYDPVRHVVHMLSNEQLVRLWRFVGGEPELPTVSAVKDHAHYSKMTMAQFRDTLAGMLSARDGDVIDALSDFMAENGTDGEFQSAYHRLDKATAVVSSSHFTATAAPAVANRGAVMSASEQAVVSQESNSTPTVAVVTPATEAKPAVEKKPRGQGIGAFATSCILNGMDNAEVLAATKAQFPGANTQLASINWYRNKAKNEKAPVALGTGNLVTGERELQTLRKSLGIVSIRLVDGKFIQVMGTAAPATPAATVTPVTPAVPSEPVLEDLGNSATEPESTEDLGNSATEPESTGDLLS